MSKRVVIVGAGFGGLTVAKALDGQPFDGARITEAEAGLDALGEAEAEAARRRKDRNDERLHRRVVHRVLAVGDLRDMDRLR